MNRRLLCAGVVVQYAFFAGGCATIFNGFDQEVTIHSIPANAEAEINGQRALTPAKMKLRRNQDYVLTVTKDGYKTYRSAITHSVSELVLLDVCFLSIVGIAIDFFGPGGYQLNPADNYVELEPSDML